MAPMMTDPGLTKNRSIRCQSKLAPSSIGRLHSSAIMAQALIIFWLPNQRARSDLSIKTKALIDRGDENHLAMILKVANALDLGHTAADIHYKDEEIALSLEWIGIFQAG